MENRFQKMDDFLKNIALYAKNKDETSYKNYIYSKLCLYSLTKEEIESKKSLTSIESRICDDFGYHPFVECNLEKGKLIYKNFGKLKNTEEKNDIQHINMYLPIKSENGFELLKELFNYTENELIANETRVLPDIRTDNVIVKLYSNDDAIKIAEFINGNLAEKIFEINPFIINDENVGISIEGKVPYINCIAYFINQYILEIKKYNDFGNCNLNGFKGYIEYLQRDCYFQNIEESKLLTIKNNLHINISNEQFIYEMENALDILLIAIDEEKGLSDFDKKWEEISKKQVGKVKYENSDTQEKNYIEENYIEEDKNEEIPDDDIEVIHPDWDNALNSEKGNLYNNYFGDNNKLTVYKKNNVFKKIINALKNIFTKRKDVEEI